MVDGISPKMVRLGYGEAPKLQELMFSGNLCDACRCWVGTSQCRARHVQSSQQKVPGRTHAQNLGAAYPQRSLWHADRRAKRVHVQLRATMHRQRVLELNHDIGMVPLAFLIAAAVGRQAID
ncbi:hypothetical protein [Bradyrhizobium sp. 139]|uniref:hypothetical protein n=1 Tax=Bradyrhizobium sp. 139 TaxID=2782616 RepID=UPI001FFAD568|nr:hypothetical protein [Bradyrhizobium sp. 139]